MMNELFEEMKNHKITYVCFYGDKFKIEIQGGIKIQASSASLIVEVLKALRGQ
ncbi:hypothetical protein [Enterobacter roggenkampii]|uniref:hypothetical protein n=1 Tax=Enterobacter roggenkampii TaxID=1812935 RepID=UPI00132FA4F5|nr:hypothetical protein [Enterobacter roggenkampii]